MFYSKNSKIYNTHEKKFSFEPLSFFSSTQNGKFHHIGMIEVDFYDPAILSVFVLISSLLSAIRTVAFSKKEFMEGSVISISRLDKEP